MPTMVASEQFLKPKDILLATGIAQGMRIADISQRLRRDWLAQPELCLPRI